MELLLNTAMIQKDRLRKNMIPNQCAYVGSINGAVKFTGGVERCLLMIIKPWRFPVLIKFAL